jgi:hypothetical protein
MEDGVDYIKKVPGSWKKVNVQPEPKKPTELVKSDESRTPRWDLGATLVESAIKKRDGLGVKVAEIAFSWVQEYHKPETVIAPKLKDNPELSDGEKQLEEVRRSMRLAEESLAVFASSVDDFYLAGGDAFPMKAIFDSGVSAEEIIGDKVLLDFLAYFVGKSKECFEDVSNATFEEHGTDKATIVGDYGQNYGRLVETWELADVNPFSREIDKRITSVKG